MKLLCIILIFRFSMSLAFNKETNKVKLLVLTDLYFNYHSHIKNNNINSYIGIRNMIEKVQPDLVIINGDAIESTRRLFKYEKNIMKITGTM